MKKKTSGQGKRKQLFMQYQKLAGLYSCVLTVCICGEVNPIHTWSQFSCQLLRELNLFYRRKQRIQIFAVGPIFQNLNYWVPQSYLLFVDGSMCSVGFGHEGLRPFQRRLNGSSLQLLELNTGVYLNKKCLKKSVVRTTELRGYS